MAFRMVKESRRFPTTQGISLALETHFFPFTRIFISKKSLKAVVFAMRYEGAFENGVFHGQGIKTYSDGER